MRVLVTGASRGIGFELVRQYSAAHPDNVVFAAVRDPKSHTSKPVVAFAAEHANVHVIPLDVDSDASIRASLSHVAVVTDRLDVLVNNAAVKGEQDQQQQQDPLTVSSEQLVAVFTTNVAGPMAVTQTYIPLLRKSAVGGKVIQVSSGLGSNQMAFLLGKPLVSYGISKAALNYMNTVFRHVVPELTFLAINPGWVETDMGRTSGSPPHQRPRLRAGTALLHRREGTREQRSLPRHHVGGQPAILRERA